MFRSYSYKYLGYDSKTDQWRHEITIVDDDFTEDDAFASSVRPLILADEAAAAVSAALIDIYSRRNLNVAGNLVLLMQYIENKWPCRDIKSQIEWYQKYVPEYPKYHDQVMDYLVFI